MNERTELVVLTGMSGAGRSTAAHALEDIGFMVVDNLPPQLIDETLELIAERQEVRRLAVVADARGGSLFEALASALVDVRQKVDRFTLVFLEADERVLVRRFESSRRPHPLQSGNTLLEAIVHERSLLSNLREQADLVIDTSDRNVHELRRAIDAAFEDQQSQLHFTISSFGFKYGLPLDADFVFDVRFLPNPFWIPELRHLTGVDAPVSEYVFSQPGAKEFVAQVKGLLSTAATGYLLEGKRFINVAVGCTGGQHRSVAVAEALTAALVESGFECFCAHRDRGRE